jgi:hypothetical protein
MGRLCSLFAQRLQTYLVLFSKRHSVKYDACLYDISITHTHTGVSLGWIYRTHVSKLCKLLVLTLFTCILKFI